MKRIKIIAVIAAIIFGASSHAMAFDLKSVLKNAAQNAGSSSDSTKKSGLGSLVGNLLSSDKIDVNSLVGEWKYDSPSVKFISDNLLQKAGGAAATSVIEGKLAPYYKTAGIQSMKLTVNADSTFVMNVRGISLNGTIATVTDPESQANFVFNFKAVKKISIGSLNTYVTKSATNQLDITFDVTKLIGLLQKISSISGSKTLGTASSLLSSYDGVCAGFRVSKVNTTNTTNTAK